VTCKTWVARWPGFKELAQEERKREVDRMLSGERVTPKALKHAEQSIRLAKE
jgi:DNA repair ATPase RecN